MYWWSYKFGQFLPDCIFIHNGGKCFEPCCKMRYWGECACTDTLLFNFDEYLDPEGIPYIYLKNILEKTNCFIFIP